jgi:hypothetical protein
VIIPDAKKALMTIMASRKEPLAEKSEAPMQNESVSDADGVPDGRHAAMQDFMAAHAEKSPQKMMEAMINFMTFHSSKSE